MVCSTRDGLSCARGLVSLATSQEFSVAEMFEANKTIAHASIPGLRLFAVQKNQSNIPLKDIVDRLGALPDAARGLTTSQSIPAGLGSKHNSRRVWF